MRTLVNEAYDKTVELLRAQAELTVQREGARRTAQYLRELKKRAEQHENLNRSFHGTGSS